MVTERFKILSDKIVANQEEDASVDPGILTTFVIDTEEWLANFVGMDSLQLLSECLQSGASFVVGKAKKDIFLRQIQSSLLVHWRLIVHSIKVGNLHLKCWLSDLKLIIIHSATHQRYTSQIVSSPNSLLGSLKTLFGFR